jgi:hypothetical protein
MDEEKLIEIQVKKSQKKNIWKEKKNLKILNIIQENAKFVVQKTLNLF